MDRPALYSSLAEYYDLVYGWKNYPAEARRVLALARRHALRPVRSMLDVGCGTGRHLATFRRSVSVAGVDLQPEMLAIARRRLGRAIPLLPGDMRTFSTGREYDAIVCLFSAIGYLRGTRSRERAFANFYRHLRPGGVALIEGWIRPSHWRGSMVALNAHDGPTAKVARVTATSRRGNRSTLDMHYLIGVPGRGVRYVHERHHQELVEPKEMIRSLRRAGFRARVLLGHPYRSRGLYVAVRPLRGAASANRTGKSRRSKFARSKPGVGERR